MKRIWQISTSLLGTLFLGTILAISASAQGYGPRSWRSYQPVTVSDSQPGAGEISEDGDSPAALSGKKSSSTNVVKQGKTTADAAPAYYAQSDISAPSCDMNCADKIGCSEPITCATGIDPGCSLQGGCGDACADCPTRNFARIEYLMWWGRGRPTPPLVTTSFNGTDMAEAGVLELDSTTVLFGGNDIGNELRHGGRLSFGRVLDANGEWMAVGRFYGLGDTSDNFSATSVAGDPILARPFFNTLLQQQDALLVGFPGVSENGRIDISTRNSMLGADAYVRKLWSGDEDMTIDFLGGYQFSRLDDDLEIRNSELILLDPEGIFAPNTTVSMRDTFRTRNEFHGGVIGLAIDTYRGPWKFEALGKIGFGNMHQTVIIDGNTVITPDVGPVTNDPQGLLARATNSGTFTRDVFTFIPEANFTLGYQHGNWMLSAGYSFMYWKHVAWAGDQIDTRVNLSNPLVGAPQPGFFLQNTDFWLQGVNFGVEYSF
jgi:hypothetical protein